MHTGTPESSVESYAELSQYCPSAEKNIECCVRMQHGVVERTLYLTSQNLASKLDSINYLLYNFGKITQHLSFSQHTGKWG